ncbi:MAG: DUF4340 domain-containing protein [Candidatus Methylomirabilia bacterium]
MRWKSTAALALIFAALAIFYYVYEVRLGPEREKAREAKDRLWMVEAKDVEEVILKRQEDSVRIKREADGWMLVEPVKGSGDKGRIDDLVTNLVTAKVGREIESDPSKLADFGLDSPAAEVTIRIKDTAEPLTLLLGERNPTQSWVYAKEGEKPAVFLLPEFILGHAEKPLIDFRDKTILAFDRQDVRQVEITYRGQVLSAEREEEATRWKMVKPHPYRADRERLVDFLDKVRFEKVKAFVAEAPESLSPYGLDRPTRVTLWTGTGEERAARHLLLGRLDPDTDGVYAMRPGEENVFLVAKEIWTKLPKTVADLRDKTLLDWDWNRVVKLELESPKGEVVLVKDDETWQISEPEELEADESEVSGVLWELRDLKALQFLADEAQAVGRYLPKPQVRVSVWEKEASSPKTVLLAPAAEKRDGKAMAYAAVARQGPVVLVQAQALKKLARSTTELRDRTLLGSFDPRDVTRLQIKDDERVMLFERKGEKDWRVVEPEKGKARGDKIADLLFTLTTLKWTDFVSPGGGEASRYGLDQPTYEVTLWKADGSEIGGLAVGKQEGDKTYLRTNASPTLYAVETGHLGDLPKVPEDLSL